MKVHYLITSLETGGAAAIIPDLVQLLEARGHRVRVTALEPRGAGMAPLLDAAGIRYDYLFPRHRMKPFQIAAFAREAARERPDVIWTSLNGASLVGAVAGRRLRIPVVCWKNSTRLRPYARWLARQARLWIADSDRVADLLATRLRLGPERLATWSLFQAQAFERLPQPWDGRGRFAIGSVGVLHPRKNYHLLIRAMAELRRQRPDLASRARLTIMGEGDERTRLQALIAALGLQDAVCLPGATRDPRPFLATLHLYVQPSRREGMGIALHEAMSAGLPVVATPVGEMTASVRASGGILLEDDIARDCAHAIAHLMDHPAELARMGLAARAYIERRYSPAAFRAAGIAVIERIEHLAQDPVRRSTPLPEPVK